MKDPLLNYIEENKDKLNAHQPDPKNWEGIQARIHPSKKRKKRITYVVSLAAVFLVGMLVVNYNQVEPTDGIVQFETDIDLIEVADSTAIIRRDEITSNIEAGNASYVGFRNVNTHINRGDNTYQWDGLGYDQVLYSVADNATYNVTIGDNNGSTYSFSSAVTSGKEDLDVGYYNKHAMIPATTQPTRGRQYWKDNQAEMEVLEPVQYDVDRYYEQYEDFDENEFETPLEQPLSTFGIDVDGAGYSNVRRYISGGYLPPKNAVKLEEMINYFDYDLPQPTGDHPFSITTELGDCPWHKDHYLMQVALQGEEIVMDEEQTNNLVFLIDVSGSMNSNDKLPLLKKSLYLLVDEMGKDDRMAIVVYSGAAGLVLPSTSGREKGKIREAIENLNAGGSTAGGAGINLAYRVAHEARVKSGNNRVILATDGDFNVGVSDDDGLVELIEEKRESGIFLSVLGFGTGNLQSSKMEKLADNGNGNYNYIDNIMEAKKVLVNEIGGTLVTIAKDVKLQVEFNPEHVKNYRLLGYENRVLATRDFNDDTKDAGDLGSGHSVVAMYEIIPSDELKMQTSNNLRYQKKLVNTSKGLKDELAIIKFRYKKPNGSKSKLIERIVNNSKTDQLSDNFYFASAVAEFGMLIRESNFRGSASIASILERARKSKGTDEFGYRAEFIRIVEHAQLLLKEYERKRATP